MYSSPATPSGTGREPRVEQVDQGVGDRPADGIGAASVDPAPRRPDRRLGRAVEVPQLRRAAAQLGGQARRQRLAAAQHLERAIAARASCATSMRQVDGVACITDTAWRWSSAPSAAGSAASSRVATTTRAPHDSGRYSSSAAMSNESVVTSSSTSSAVMPGASAIEVRKLTTLACSTITPLGLPVEPDV